MGSTRSPVPLQRLRPAGAGPARAVGAAGALPSRTPLHFALISPEAPPDSCKGRRAQAAEDYCTVERQ